MSKFYLSVFMLFWSVLLAIVGIQQKRIVAAQTRVITVQSSTIMRLHRIVEKQGALIDWHGRRLTQLERPNEPVYQPRNPGRLGQIGSAD